MNFIFRVDLRWRLHHLQFECFQFPRPNLLQALARRFQPVFVDQPTVEESISILRGLKQRYEMHHGVPIADSAIVAAVTLSDRYITERFLPDKAIDLMDEAASRLRMQAHSKPEALDAVDRLLMQKNVIDCFVIT